MIVLYRNCSKKSGGFRRDFWGSATDVSWGVYTTESGWTAGWVAAIMGLRQLNSSLWDAGAPFGAALNRTLARELCLRYFEGDEALCRTQVAAR
jgi:hypothetical protein|eukprot:COSAG06_NODE_21193_length_766_cov_1.283358_1_plen_94_part_00